MSLRGLLVLSFISLSSCAPIQRPADARFSKVAADDGAAEPLAVIRGMNQQKLTGSLPLNINRALHKAFNKAAELTVVTATPLSTGEIQTLFGFDAAVEPVAETTYRVSSVILGSAIKLTSRPEVERIEAAALAPAGQVQSGGLPLGAMSLSMLLQADSSKLSPSALDAVEAALSGVLAQKLKGLLALSAAMSEAEAQAALGVAVTSVSGATPTALFSFNTTIGDIARISSLDLVNELEGSVNLDPNPGVGISND